MTEKLKALLEQLSRFSNGPGQTIFVECQSASSLQMAWLSYVRGAQLTGAADVLLDGIHASLIETCSFVSLGLVRPAIFSIRAQVDMVFAWLYFRHHGIEWRRVEEDGEGYRLPSDVLKYLATHFPRHPERLALLRKHRLGKIADPYRLLSAHVHSQNTRTIPPLGDPVELVAPIERARECLSLQSDVSEYVSDLFVTLFHDQWMDLPSQVTKSVQDRLSASELKYLCT